MNITIVVPGRVPALLYGGTERVVYDLARELSLAGNDVTLIAAPGSYADFARVIERDESLPVASQVPEGTDVIHFQENVPGGPLPAPYIVTCHGNRLSLSEEAKKMSVYVSANHARRHGCTAFVHNGLDWDTMYPDADILRKRSGFHFLGKASWRRKNVRGAMRIVRSIPGETLDVLGGSRLNLKQGFRLTLSPRIHFHGMVDNAAKQRVIERSRGLIFPVLWHEPFGLAITESLYLGAPVFATPWGSVRELVGSEVGFVSDSMGELAAAMASAGDFSPKVCHEYAREKFGAAPMARKYLHYYEEAIAGRPLNPEVRTVDEALLMERCSMRP